MEHTKIVHTFPLLLFTWFKKEKKKIKFSLIFNGKEVENKRLKKVKNYMNNPSICLICVLSKNLLRTLYTVHCTLYTVHCTCWKDRTTTWIWINVTTIKLSLRMGKGSKCTVPMLIEDGVVSKETYIRREHRQGRMKHVDENNGYFNNCKNKLKTFIKVYISNSWVNIIWTKIRQFSNPEEPDMFCQKKLPFQSDFQFKTKTSF